MDKEEVIRQLENINLSLAGISVELDDVGLDIFARRVHAQELRVYEVLKAILDTQNG